MPSALQHEYPQWQDDDNGEMRAVWTGYMRIVSAKRARKLRKRGVPLMPLHAVLTVNTDRFDKRTGYSTYSNRIEPITPNGRARYAWFELSLDVEARKQRRALICRETWCDAEQGLRGRKHELEVRLAAQRLQHLSELIRKRWRRIDRMSGPWDFYTTASDIFGEPYGIGVPAFYEPNNYTCDLALSYTSQKPDVLTKAAALFDGLHHAEELRRYVLEIPGLPQLGPMEGYDSTEPFTNDTP